MATISVTKGYEWTSGEAVTPTKLNSAATPVVGVSAIVNADIASNAAIAASKLASTLDLSGKTVTLPNTSVTLAQLVTAVQQSLLPAGSVMPFAMNSAPAGWLAANGDAVSRSTYAALFAAIGTTHGTGDGSTTFNLPDLRGIFVRGSGSQTISGTSYSGIFATKQQDEFKSHTHGNVRRVASDGGGIASVGATASPSTSSTSTDATGGTETRPANIALLYCIKF